VVEATARARAERENFIVMCGEDELKGSD